MLQTSNGLYRAKIDTVSLQNDGGANRSCTNMKHLLLDFKEIDPYPIQGVKENAVAIYCTGFGFLP